MKRMKIVSILVWISAFSCNKSSSQSGGETSAGTSTTTTTAEGASTADPDSWLNGYYTGINGSDKFSFYLPSFRQMTITDSSIASLTTETVTLSTETIDALVAEKKAADPTFDDTKLREMLGRQRTVQKITPLKAGQTTLKTTGGGKGPGGSTWNQGQSIALVVASYTTDLVSAGKARYEAAGTGTSVSCLSCHEGGANGAPPHALGSILSLPDASAEKWISTGKVGGRTASVDHAWSFASENEKLGVVAYLRTLQAADLETLTKLEFENQVANLPAPPAQ